MSTNFDLGREISDFLIKNNLENAFDMNAILNWTDEKYLQELENKLADFIALLGIDLNNQSLANTPKRIAKLFIEDLFWGLDYRNFPKITVDDNSFSYTSPLISKNIPIHSTCEHHFVAINGFATIAYIPVKKVIGLGNLNQIVDFFAHRPQMQERLTCQIFRTLQYLLDTKDVAVAMKASHDCITRRKSKVMNNEVISIELGGKFLSDDILKTNFYQLANEIK